MYFNLILKIKFGFVLFFMLFFCNNLFANLDNFEKCNELASEAKTKRGHNLMLLMCVNDLDKLKTNFYNRSKAYKCAKKAYKLNTQSAVDYTWVICMNKE